PQIQSDLAAGADTVYLQDGQVEGTAIYLKKVADGIPINHHSRLTYLAAEFPDKAQYLYTATSIHDANVLQDYHNILIPKAVEYSTGILDYFFRGSLTVTWEAATTQGQSKIQISNTSGQDFSGGQFHLFWDDLNDVRNEITSPNFSTTYSGTLANGASIEATYVPPTSPITQYIVIYQGAITPPGNDPDPVEYDSGGNPIAIASAQLPGPDWSQLEWGTPYYNNPQAGTFSPVNAPSALASLTAVSFTGQYGEQDGIVDNTGTLPYNGSGCTCKFHVHSTASPHGAVEVEIDSSLHGTLWSGLYVGNRDFDQTFSIPDTGSKDDTISVIFYGDTVYEVDGYPNQASGTLTLSNP
ncbi:MAG: hypothetical protein KGJ60_08375, partial [Verrucomicrobiota bacterium]|nr:hypothetical protein [Verrucomicrobiota bacterium]